MPFRAMPMEKVIPRTINYCTRQIMLKPVKVTYDPNKISLDKLLQYYFRVIDPTSINKQGNDRGRQYRTAFIIKMNKIKRL